VRVTRRMVLVQR